VGPKQEAVVRDFMDAWGQGEEITEIETIMSMFAEHTQRLDHFTIKGQRINHSLTAVFEVDDDGLIAAWREYFDSADVARQLGIPAVTA
jgi:limonene-1,2-epoxide hydrolase